MTTVVERPARAVSDAPPPRRVVRALAVREARWILRHPLFLIGIAGSIALTWITTAWWHAPVLHRDDARFAGCLLPLAGTTLIVCNLAAYRARRHDTEEIEDAAPTTRARRTAAQLAAFLAPVLVACALAGAYVAYLYALGGIWAPSAQELATGPAIVALAAAAGVALGRWIASPLAGPLALGAFAAWQARGGGARGPSYTNWFVPFVDAGNENRIPEVTVRPAGWHVVYLLGLAGIFVAVALLRHGSRPRRLAFLAAVIALSIFGGAMQARPVPARVVAEKTSLATDPGRQVCETRATVTYCVFPAYRALIDRYDDIARAVLAPVPPAQRPRFTIRQVLSRDDLSWLGVTDNEAEPEEDQRAAPDYNVYASVVPADLRDSDAIPMRPVWARGKDAVGAGLDLALAVARRAIGASDRVVVEQRRYTTEDIAGFQSRLEGALGEPGAEPSPIPPSEAPQPPAVGDAFTYTGICSTEGQAREAIGVWLALRAVPGSMPWLRDTIPQRGGPSLDDLRARGDHDPMGSVLTYHGITFVWSTMDIPFSSGGILTAFDMMARPEEGLRPVLTADWASWTNPKTTLASLRSAFGLPAPDPRAPHRLQMLPPSSRPPVCS